MNVWSSEKYFDLANLVLGAILFFSPWIFGFAVGYESQNAIFQSPESGEILVQKTLELLS